MLIKKIHLACGRNIIDNWENYDLNPVNTKVQFIDMLKDFPFEDDSIDFFFLEHAIEHFDELQGYKVLEKIFNKLKKGGVLRILTPSLDTYINRFLNWDAPFNQKHKEFFGSKTRFLNYAFYGEHFSGLDFLDGKRSLDIGHKFIYSIEDIQSKLKSCGFTKIEFKNLKESDHKELRNIDCRNDNIDIILEATK